MGSFALVGAITPGPVNVLALRHGSHGPRRQALLYVLGASLSYGAIVALMGLFATQMALLLPQLAGSAQWVCAAYLLWLAWKLSQARQLSEASAAALSVGFWQGAALQFVNIKAWMLALAIVSGWVAGHNDPGQRLAIVVPTMMGFAFSSNFLYATMGSLLRDWLRGPEGSGVRLRLFNRCMALVLVATALWMAVL